MYKDAALLSLKIKFKACFRVPLKEQVSANFWKEVKQASVWPVKFLWGFLLVPKIGTQREFKVCFKFRTSQKYEYFPEKSNEKSGGLELVSQRVSYDPLVGGHPRQATPACSCFWLVPNWSHSESTGRPQGVSSRLCWANSPHSWPPWASEWPTDGSRSDVQFLDETSGLTFCGPVNFGGQ